MPPSSAPVALPCPPAAAAFALTGDGEAFVPRTTLRPAEIDAFDRRGFHIHDPLFSPAEVAVIRDACDRVAHGASVTGLPADRPYWRPGDDPKKLCKIDNVWKADPLLQAAVTSPRLGRIAAQLIGAFGMRLWHDQYLRKPSDGGGMVRWHQDWMHWQGIDRCRTVTCWIALGDVTPAMGPMLFLEGSHHGGLRLDLKPTYAAEGELPEPPGDQTRPRVPVLIRAGQVSFHHGNTMHASDVNRSGTDRIALVSHLVAEDCCYRPGMGHLVLEHMLQYPDHPQAGERFRGPQFPSCWRAD